MLCIMFKILNQTPLTLKTPPSSNGSIISSVGDLTFGFLNFGNTGTNAIRKKTVLEYTMRWKYKTIDFYLFQTNRQTNQPVTVSDRDASG